MYERATLGLETAQSLVLTVMAAARAKHGEQGAIACAVVGSLG
jgi:hypothetical protein